MQLARPAAGLGAAKMQPVHWQRGFQAAEDCAAAHPQQAEGGSCLLLPAVAELSWRHRRRRCLQGPRGPEAEAAQEG